MGGLSQTPGHEGDHGTPRSWLRGWRAGARSRGVVRRCLLIQAKGRAFRREFHVLPGAYRRDQPDNPTLLGSPQEPTLAG